MKGTCVIYTRVSDKGQVGGLSLDVQLEACTKWAREREYQIVGTYRDGGITGTKLVGREGMEDAIIQCQKEHVNLLLVIDTDRMARNELDHFNIRSVLKKGGTQLIAINQPGIDDSAEGMLLDGMLANINAFYSRLLGRKVKKSLEKKCQMGDFPGWGPCGYLNVNKGTEDKPIRIIEVDPEKGSLMTEMFKLYSSGDLSVDALVEIMYKKGLRSKTGIKVCRTVLFAALKNIFYTGKFEFNEEIFQGNHLPLTTPEIFELCQRVTATHNRNACRKRKYRWLLNGFVYCIDHDSRLFGDWTVKKDKAYYHGHTNKNCNHYIALGELEKEVTQQFKRIKFTDEFIERIVNKVKDLVNQSRENKSRDIEDIRNAIKQLEIKRRDLENKLLDHTVDSETFKRMHAELEIQIQGHKNEMTTIEHEGGIDLNVIADILEVAKNVGQAYEKAGFNVKRHYLSMFFQRIEVSGKHIVNVVYTPLLENLIYAKGVRISSNWLPLWDAIRTALPHFGNLQGDN